MWPRPQLEHLYHCHRLPSDSGCEGSGVPHHSHTRSDGFAAFGLGRSTLRTALFSFDFFFTMLRLLQRFLPLGRIEGESRRFRAAIDRSRARLSFRAYDLLFALSYLVRFTLRATVSASSIRSSLGKRDGERSPIQITEQEILGALWGFEPTRSVEALSLVRP